MVGACVVGVGDYGRGVFASAPIKKGAEIEFCPLIELEDGWDITPPLKYYAIELTEFNALFLMLGYGSLYNHNRENPNAAVTVIDRQTVVFHAIQDISAGEEILYDYQFDGPEEFM